MSISEQAKMDITRLIHEGESLDPLDSEEVDRWMQASYESLGFHRVQQERFDEYCRSSDDSTSMRLYLGVWMLKLSIIGADDTLNEDIPATLSSYS
jgi:hypothetical protein